MKQSPTDMVWTTDVAVPMSRLPAIIEQTKADIKRSGLLGSIVGHVGDGNFHSILLFPEEKRHMAEGLVHRMVEKAIEMKGTAAGENGVGLVKRDYLEKELGKTTVDTMRKASGPNAASVRKLTNLARQMESALDPLCILNCDKIVRMKS